MKKSIIFSKDCKEQTFKGVKLMYDSVSRTLGPYGQSVLVDYGGMVIGLTKDGVTVAEQVGATNRFEEMGVKLIREASQKTNEAAGDSTTSVIVLAYEMCKRSLDFPSTANVISIRKGMKKAMDICVEAIKKNSWKVEKETDFRKVAVTACQDEHWGKTVTEAFMKSGKRGAIDIERRLDEPGIEYEKVDGLSFSAGWMNRTCINDPKNRAICNDIRVLVTDKEISSHYKLLPLLKSMNDYKEEGIAKPLRELLIIAGNIDGSAMGLIHVNNTQPNKFYIIPVKAPSFGMQKIGLLRDIAIATGATFVSEEEGTRLEQTTVKHLGFAKKVIIEKERSIIIPEQGVQTKKRISDRCDEIQQEIDNEKVNLAERENLQRRLAALTDGITIIRIEGHTQQEYMELRTRTDDAVRALQSTREEGALAGCGIGYLIAKNALETRLKSFENRDERLGAELVYDALSAPSLRVLEVAGIQEKEIIVSRMRETGKGYDFDSGELTDMKKKGIWDAAKAVRCALEYSISCAASFVTLGVSIACEPDEREIMHNILEHIKE